MEARVLLATRLAAMVAETAAQRHTVETLTGPEGLDAAVTRPLRYDVVVTDLLWQDRELEGRFDGLDVMAAFQRAGRHVHVLLALNGRAAEVDYLREAVDQPEVSGAVMKNAGMDRFHRAIDVIAAGGTDFDTCDPPQHELDTPLAIHRVFARTPTAAAVAGVIARTHATSWLEIAELTGYSPRTVEAVPTRLADLIVASGGMDRPDRVNQASLFKWCGAHAAYITSWCRRHLDETLGASDPDRSHG